MQSTSIYLSNLNLFDQLIDIFPFILVAEDVLYIQSIQNCHKFALSFQKLLFHSRISRFIN